MIFGTSEPLTLAPFSVLGCCGIYLSTCTPNGNGIEVPGTKLLWPSLGGGYKRLPPGSGTPVWFVGTLRSGERFSPASIGFSLEASERPRAGSPDGLPQVVTESAQPAPESGQTEVACSVKRPVDQASPEIMEKAPDHGPSKPTEPGLAGPEDAPGHSVGMASPEVRTSQAYKSKPLESKTISGTSFDSQLQTDII